VNTATDDLVESPTGSLLEEPIGLEALFEGGDDVSFCSFTAAKKRRFLKKKSASSFKYVFVG
jgi:hypothetical protein